MIQHLSLMALARGLTFGDDWSGDVPLVRSLGGFVQSTASATPYTRTLSVSRASSISEKETPSPTPDARRTRNEAARFHFAAIGGAPERQVALDADELLAPGGDARPPRDTPNLLQLVRPRGRRPARAGVDLLQALDHAGGERGHAGAAGAAHSSPQRRSPRTFLVQVHAEEPRGDQLVVRLAAKLQVRGALGDGEGPAPAHREAPAAADELNIHNDHINLQKRV